MYTALDKIRHEKFVAVFLDKSRSGVDDLEFILNIRDIGQSIPILIVGKVSDARTISAIREQPNVFLLGDKPLNLKEKIIHKMDEVENK
jgi:hypothetical protein